MNHSRHWRTFSKHCCTDHRNAATGHEHMRHRHHLMHIIVQPQRARLLEANCILIPLLLLAAQDVVPVKSVTNLQMTDASTGNGMDSHASSALCNVVPAVPAKHSLHREQRWLREERRRRCVQRDGAWWCGSYESQSCETARREAGVYIMVTSSWKRLPSMPL